jgi:hypothetical protein
VVKRAPPDHPAASRRHPSCPGGEKTCYAFFGCAVFLAGFRCAAFFASFRAAACGAAACFIAIASISISHSGRTSELVEDPEAVPAAIQRCRAPPL